MRLPSLVQIVELPGLLVSYCGYILGKTFLSPGGSLSLASLLSALCVILLFWGLRRPSERRAIKLRALVRALFPKRLWQSSSAKADIRFFFLNSLVFGALIGWALLSYHLVSKTVNGALAAQLGVLQPTALSEFTCALILTVALFLAYELGYFIDHYLSHAVPALWEFHKVHHTAEVLSPLTNFRVHPVDTLVFYNVLAVVMGTTGGVLTYLFGKSIDQFALWNSNVIVLAFTYLIDHLHHSNVWIAFTGGWGRVLLSPAHHQVHHSTDPAHFNKNMGSCLAIFDWACGTLYVPSKKRERLIFGVEPKTANDHTITGSLVTPFRHGWLQLVPVLLWPWRRPTTPSRVGGGMAGGPALGAPGGAEPS